MEKRRFGGTDMDVSVLGFGSSEIGFSDIAEEKVGRLLNEALDAGLNVIDTAECYGNAEELIGNTVSHRRDDFFLFIGAFGATAPLTEDQAPFDLTGDSTVGLDDFFEFVDLFGT